MSMIVEKKDVSNEGHTMNAKTSLWGVNSEKKKSGEVTYISFAKVGLVVPVYRKL